MTDQQPEPATAEIDDHALMARIAQGDQRAYRLLVDRHLARSLGFAQRMTGNRQDAEEILQEAFLKAWLEAPRWQPLARFSTWFYRVVSNACIDRLRARKPTTQVDEQLADNSDNAEVELQDKQTQQQVQRALAALPERQRLALVLFHYEERSQAELAEILGLSIGAAESLLFRARQSLKEKLAFSDKVALRQQSGKLR